MQRIGDIRSLKANSKKIQTDETEMLAPIESNHLIIFLNHSVGLMFPFCKTLSTIYNNERSD
jgi:hypothetical protein